MMQKPVLGGKLSKATTTTLMRQQHKRRLANCLTFTFDMQQSARRLRKRLPQLVIIIIIRPSIVDVQFIKSILKRNLHLGAAAAPDC